MISHSKNKILFFDLETVGMTPDLTMLESNYESHHRLFMSYLDYFRRKYPDTESMSPDEVFESKSALIPEFGKIICATFSFITPKGDVHTQTFNDESEKDLLMNIKNLLDKVYDLDFYLCGHNIKVFDIPFLGKKFLSHGILPPKILPSYETKPWEIKAIDTKDLWSFGSNYGLSSLDLMCISMGFESPKTGEVFGKNIHKSYWYDQKLEEITEYCEKDVESLLKIISKIYDLK
jgi:DNA polymerase elongation subunit (family B)